MRPDGLSQRLPPGWAGKNLTDEVWVCGFLGCLWPLKAGERRRILENLTREDRNWIFRLFDNAPDMTKKLMLTGVWLEYKTNPGLTKRPFVANAQDILKNLDVVRCLACKEVSHVFDRYPRVPLCYECGCDFVFLGHDLRDICRRLRSGEAVL